MDIVAAAILFGAAVSGFIALVHISMGMHINKKIRLIHIALVVAGIVSLLLYAIFTNSHEKHINILIMLAIAIIPGLFLIFGKPGAIKIKGLALIYALTGMFAFLWLLTYIIPQ